MRQRRVRKPRQFEAKNIKVTSPTLGPLADLTPTQVRYRVKRTFHSKEEHRRFEQWLKNNEEIVRKNES